MFISNSVFACLELSSILSFAHHIFSSQGALFILTNVLSNRSCAGHPLPSTDGTTVTAPREHTQCYPLRYGFQLMGKIETSIWLPYDAPVFSSHEISPWERIKQGAVS